VRSEIWRHFDFWLLGAVAILIIFGVAMINSSIADNIELVELNVVGRQIVFAVIGFVAIMIATAMDYHLWVTISKVLYLGIAGALVFLFISGRVFFGAARWLEVGLINIQPSELAKIILIIIIADFFSRHQERIRQLEWIGLSLIPTLILVVLIIVQPDLSTSIVLFVIWFALLWVTGLQIRHLGLFAIIGFITPIISWPFLADYQKQRLIDFIFPDVGARYGSIYNVNQARITLGSGGLLGQGYGQGPQVQLRFLKVRHIDFIFSAIGEEFGFVGNVVVVLLLLFIIYRCLRAARLSHDTFGALLCYGVATLISFQAIVNIGMNLNLIPVTGLPLPFISYGGSSLLTLMLGIGLVESVISRHRILEF
jgi:rod shape determining protein RodA